MNKCFYLKLAFMNLKKSRSTYVPYFLACIGTVFMYFLLMSLANNPGMKNIPESETLKTLFDMGGVVTAIFSIIFILYANSFLMKRRKNEIGLFSILGLEKRHISYIMFYETAITAITGITAGIFMGILFGKLCFLLLLQFVKFSPDSSFQIEGSTVLSCILFFVVLFLVTFVVNYIQVKTNNPVNLMRGEKAGEKEPRSSLLLLLIGMAGLGIGYYLSQTASSVFTSISVFIIAVICVIIGTYALFTSGSIFVLKWLKKRKGIYYTRNNFISISNMIYRMKKNAAGLASICIISTMVLVVLSTTIAMSRGKEQMIRERNPQDLIMESSTVDSDIKKLNQVFEKTAANLHVKIRKSYWYTAADLAIINQNSSFLPFTDADLYQTGDDDSIYDIRLVPAADYNRLGNARVSLNQNEVLLYMDKGVFEGDAFTIGGQSYQIKQQLEKYEFTGWHFNGLPVNRMYLVVRDETVMKTMLEAADEKSSLQYVVCADLEGLSDNKIKLADQMEEYLKGIHKNGSGNYNAESYDKTSKAWDSLYGGLLFLGIVLGILFLIAMVLIIYFKQVSEGYEDRTRFEVMQKVGMDQKEIRQAINRQIRMCFILPVAGALLHVGFAFHTLNLMLLMLGFFDAKLLLRCVVLVSVLFCILYFTVYQMTSKVYQHIIDR